MANHRSHYDTPVVFTHLPYQVRIIAKQSLAMFPVLGWHLKRGGHLFVDRRDPDRMRDPQTLAGAGFAGPLADHLPGGDENADGHVARFKAGSFLLAIQAGLPIVPLSIVGTRAVMPKGRLRTEPAHVTLIVHDPIQPAAIPEPTVHDAKALAERVHDIVAGPIEHALASFTADRVAAFRLARHHLIGQLDGAARRRLPRRRRHSGAGDVRRRALALDAPPATTRADVKAALWRGATS